MALLQVIEHLFRNNKKLTRRQQLWNKKQKRIGENRITQERDENELRRIFSLNLKINEGKKCVIFWIYILRF